MVTDKLDISGGERESSYNMETDDENLFEKLAKKHDEHFKLREIYEITYQVLYCQSVL